MRKILFVVHAFRVGGVSTVLTNIANSLYKTGYDITIAVTCNDVSGAYNLLPGIKLKHRDEPKFKLCKRIPYIRNFYDYGMWCRRRTPKRLYKYFIGKNEKFDVEIAFFFGRPLKTICGSPNNYSKKILWVHSDYDKIGAGAFTGFGTKKEALNAYKFFDRIVCVSKNASISFKNNIKRFDNVDVIYNLNDSKTIKSLSQEKIDIERVKFTFVCVGRLSEEKGFVRVLESSAKLIKDGFDFDVWIVGDGPEKIHLEKFITENNLDNVKLLGNKNNPYPYILSSDMLVCPSKSEAYGLSVSEAFILKIPVLVTDCAGPRELVGEGEYGVLVDNTSEAVYKGMKKVLNDRAFYEYYRHKAETRSEFFSSESIMQDIERLLNE